MASKDIKPEKPAGKGETSGKGGAGGVERKTMMKFWRKSMAMMRRKSMRSF